MHAYWCGTHLFGCDWPGLVTFWPTPWWTLLGRFIPLGGSPGPGCWCGLFTRAATMNSFFIRRRTFWNVLVARRGRFLIHHFVTVKRKRGGQLSHKIKRSLSVPMPWSGAQCTEPIDHMCVHVSLCSLMVFICLFIDSYVCICAMHVFLLSCKFASRLWNWKRSINSYQNYCWDETWCEDSLRHKGGLYLQYGLTVASERINTKDYWSKWICVVM